MLVVGGWGAWKGGQCECQAVKTERGGGRVLGVLVVEEITESQDDGEIHRWRGGTRWWW